LKAASRPKAEASQQGSDHLFPHSIFAKELIVEGGEFEIG
jgi:hypothetical protein